MPSPSSDCPREYAVAPSTGLAVAGVLLFLLALVTVLGGPGGILAPAFAVVLAGAAVDLLRGWGTPRTLRCTFPDRVRWRLNREEDRDGRGRRGRDGNCAEFPLRI